MNEYEKLKNRQQKEFNAFPIKFAFSDKQFEEMMKNWDLSIDDTDKIYKIPGGGFIKKEDSKLFHEMLDRHEKELQKAISEDKDGTGFIFQMFLSELNNHEYIYTQDITDTLEALGYSYDDIMGNSKLHKGLIKACKKTNKRGDFLWKFQLNFGAL